MAGNAFALLSPMACNRVCRVLPDSHCVDMVYFVAPCRALLFQLLLNIDAGEQLKS